MAFRYYRRFLQGLKHLRGLDLGHMGETISEPSCAACPTVYHFNITKLNIFLHPPFFQEGGKVQVCMDACFQLVQKNKGFEYATDKELSEWSFLCDQKVVDELGRSSEKYKDKDTQVKYILYLLKCA